MNDIESEIIQHENNNWALCFFLCLVVGLAAFIVGGFTGITHATATARDDIADFIYQCEAEPEPKYAANRQEAVEMMEETE